MSSSSVVLGSGRDARAMACRRRKRVVIVIDGRVGEASVSGDGLNT
jgi:hypothetical protein